MEKGNTMRDMDWDKFKDKVIDEVTEIIYDYTYADYDGDMCYVEGGYDASQKILNHLKKYTIWSEEKCVE